MTKGRLDLLLDGLGIKLVPVHRRRAPAESHARGTMQEIRGRYGDGHLVFVLRCIRQTGSNRDELWSDTIGAVSDVLAQREDWALQRPGVSGCQEVRLFGAEGLEWRERPLGRLSDLVVW